MTIRWPALAALLASSLVAAGAGAQTATPDYVFDTVDSYRIAGTGAVVTGVQHGQTAATTVQFGATTNIAACERAFIQSMNRPGRFTVSVYSTQFSSGSCEIKRNP